MRYNDTMSILCRDIKLQCANKILKKNRNVTMSLNKEEEEKEEREKRETYFVLLIARV